MKNMDKLKILIFSLLTIIGIILIGWGTTKDNEGWYAILTATGGALLGSTIPMFLAEFFGDNIKKIRDYLLSENRFSSNPDEVAGWDGQWYLYHTSIKDGKERWICEDFNLVSDKYIGTLKCETKTKLENGRLQPYYYYAGVRSDRLIFIAHSPKGTESHSIAVVKGGTNEHQDIRCGLLIHQTWDGTQAFSPVLLSQKLLKIDGQALNFVEKSSFLEIEENEKLNQLWVLEVKNQKINILFPNIMNYSS